MKELSPRLLLFLFGIAFLVKFLTAMYIRYLIGCTPIDHHLDELVVHADDYFSYHGAMENYIQTGKYYFFNGRENVYAGRLPHYSIPYYLLRQVLNVAYTNFVIMILQIAGECLAFIYLAKLALKITQSKLAFYLVYFIYLISFLTSFYNNTVLPDSLSISVLIFFLYFFHQYLFAPTAKTLWAAGLFLGWLVVLKPYFSLSYIEVGLFFIWQVKSVFSKKGIYQLFLKTSIVALPLLVFITPWVLRNYGVHQTFIPFQVNTIAGYNYTSADLACRRFLQSIGENFIEWEKTSAGNYFNKNCIAPCRYQLPAYAYTKNYDSAKVEQVRRAYLQLQHRYSVAQDHRVTAAFNQLTQSFRTEKPLYYYIIAPIMLSKKFLFTDTGYFLRFSCPGWSTTVTYLMQAILYWSTLLGGSVGLFWLTRKDWRHSIFIAIPIYLVIFFPILFRGIETRYFAHSFPVLLLGLVYFIHQIRSKLRINSPQPI